MEVATDSYDMIRLNNSKNNKSNAHAKTFVLLNSKTATISTCFRKLKFWI